MIGVVIASIIGAAIQFDLFWPYGPSVHGALAIRISVLPFPGSAGTLLRAAAANFYQARWSSQILDELTRNLVSNGTMSEQ